MSAAQPKSRSVTLAGGLSLSELAGVVSGRLIGGDRHIGSLSTDTRELIRGDLFIALRGERFDAHVFVAEAVATGAAAVVVDRDIAVAVPVVRVDDTRLALGRLAAWWRSRFDIPVAGITGSNGKTTVKEMLACILSGLGPGVVTRGNLNNEIGAPLTLLKLTPADRFAVIEMGARKPGDIAYLVGLASPTVTVITNAAPAHLAGFGDIAGVARAKGEIFAGLAEDGIAVMNHDDPRVGLWRVMAGSRRIVSFGMRHPADVTAQAVRPNDAPGCSFELCTPAGRATVEQPLPGRHNVMNALAAAAMAHALGVPLAQIVRGLEAMRPVAGRLQIKPGIGGIRIIDDTYNANPGSVKAALEVLATCGGSGEKLLVLGDMGELGNAARALHEQIGRQARVVGVARIYAVGELACVAAGTFGNGARHFDSHDALIAGLRADLADAGAATVLVKGSRSMRMERVVDALTAGATGAGNRTHAHEMRAGG
jgi:UDP-N-acetylmuramoyl-tripeptide--D-alanyl-D-alanine ligase